jgi:sugar phosphate isomerase/epimerase
MADRPTYSYDPACGSERDQLRLAVGDADCDENGILADQEIDALLERAARLGYDGDSKVARAAALWCDAYANLIARDGVRVVAGAFSQEQALSHYREMAARFERQALEMAAEAGGGCLVVEVPRTAAGLRDVLSG